LTIYKFDQVGGLQSVDHVAHILIQLFKTLSVFTVDSPGGLEINLLCLVLA